MDSIFLPADAPMPLSPRDPLTAMTPTALPALTDDESLLQRYRDHGDRDGLEALLGRLGEFGFRTALGILGNAADAEDAVQTAFIQVLLHADTYRSGGGVRPWFIRIVINACRMQRRAGDRLRAREQHAVAPVAVPPPPDQDVLEALAALAQKLQVPIRLRYLEGLDYAEIASALAIPEKTARSRVARGLERLRLTLGPAPAPALGIGAVLHALPAAATPAATAARMMAISAKVARMDHATAAAAITAGGLPLVGVLVALLAVLGLGTVVAFAAWPLRTLDPARPLPPARSAAAPAAAGPPPSPFDQLVTVHLFGVPIDNAVALVCHATVDPAALTVVIAHHAGGMEQDSPDLQRVIWPNREQRALPVRRLLGEIASQSGYSWRIIDGIAYFWQTLPASARQPILSELSNPSAPGLMYQARESFKELHLDLDCERIALMKVLTYRGRLYRTRFDDVAAQLDGSMPTFGADGAGANADGIPLCRALGREPDVEQALVAALDAATFPDPVQAVVLAGALGSHAAASRLLARLADPVQCEMAERALVRMHYTPAIPALLGQLAAIPDTAQQLLQPGPRQLFAGMKPQAQAHPALSLVLTLGCLGEPSVVPLLVQRALAVPGTWEGPDAIQALWHITTPGADQALCGLLLGSQDRIADEICGLLIQTPRLALAPACRQRLARTTDRELRYVLRNAYLLCAAADADQVMAFATSPEAHIDPALDDPRYPYPQGSDEDEPTTIAGMLRAHMDTGEARQLARGLEHSPDRAWRRLAATIAATGRDTESASLVLDTLQRHPADAIGADAACGLATSDDERLILSVLDADRTGRIEASQRPLVLSRLRYTWQSHPQPVRDYLTAVTCSTAPVAVRVAAVQVFYRYLTPDLDPALMATLLAEPDTRLRAAALWLGRNDHDHAAQWRRLHAALYDPHSYIRETALSLLSEHIPVPDAEADAPEPLAAVLSRAMRDDPDWHVRRMAIPLWMDELEHSEHDNAFWQQAAEELRPLLHDPSPQVRATAAWALAGGIYTVPPTDLDQQNTTLLQQLASGDQDPLVRSIASAGLQEISTRPTAGVSSAWRRNYEPQWSDDSVMPRASQ